MKKNGFLASFLWPGCMWLTHAFVGLLLFIVLLFVVPLTATIGTTIMAQSRPSKPERRWYQFGVRTPLVFALLVLSGCGPSTDEPTKPSERTQAEPSNEQQVIDASNPGVDHAMID